MSVSETALSVQKKGRKRRGREGVRKEERKARRDQHAILIVLRARGLICYHGNVPSPIF